MRVSLTHGMRTIEGVPDAVDEVMRMLGTIEEGAI